MGLLDMIGSLAGDASKGDNAKVMGGLVQALESHPEGIQGVLKSFTANGLGDHVEALNKGETPNLSSDQIQQGLQGTGLIEKAAQHAGVSPQVVQTAIVTVLPLIMAHFVKSGSAAPGTPGATGTSSLGDMAQTLMKKFTA